MDPLFWLPWRHRWKICLIVAALALLAWSGAEADIARRSMDRPIPLTCAQLYEFGPPREPYVRIEDLVLCPWAFGPVTAPGDLEQEQPWRAILVPAVPRHDPRGQAVVAWWGARQRRPPPPLGEVRLLVRVAPHERVEDVRSVSGIVREYPLGTESLWAGIRIERYGELAPRKQLVVLEKGPGPAGWTRIVAVGVAGVVLLGIGLVLLFTRRGVPPATSAGTPPPSWPGAVA